MKSNRILPVILVLQVLTLAGQWLAPSYVTPASAQIPDAGAQRNQVIEEMKSVNSKLDKLISILESGKLQVRTTTSDDKRDAR